MPGVDWDDKASLLMELEKAGAVYRPEPSSLTRMVLRQRLTDVAIDEMLRSDALKYHDFARMAEDKGASEGASLLKSIFGVSDTLMILTSWLADEAHDKEIAEKDAVPELRAVVTAKLGFELPSDARLQRMRASTQRYVLANDFRGDSEGRAPVRSQRRPSNFDKRPRAVCARDREAAA